MIKKFITEKEVSAMTGRALQTLRNDRFKGKGFPYIKIGKSVRYDEGVVIAIMEKNKIEISSFQPDENKDDHSFDNKGMANNNQKEIS